MRTPRSTRAVFRLSPLVAALACALAPADAAAGIITVTNNADSGPGSLRQAISDANVGCFTDLAPTIQFSGPFVIQPSTPLPAFNCSNAAGAYRPTVDGTVGTGYVPNSDPNGFNGNLKILLDGSVMLAYGGGDGLNFNAFYGGVLTVQGLELANFNSALQGNLIVKGSYIHNSASHGVLINSPTGSGSVVGGPNPADRNFFAFNYVGAGFTNVSNITVSNNAFASNSNAGVYASSVAGLTIDTGNRFVSNQYGIIGSLVTGASISGNFIGTTDGSSNAGNGTYGIDWDESSGTIEFNVIIGNRQAGVHMIGDGGTQLRNNKIGVDVSGNLGVGNVTGVLLDFSYGAQIHDNTISGNLYGGIIANFDSGSSIRLNKIGTNAAGTAAVANGSDYFNATLSGLPYGGVALQSSSNTLVEGNTISGNVGPGIDLLDSTAIQINDNFIGTNFAGNAPLANTTGITTHCGRNVKIHDNLIAGNSGRGIELLGTNGPGAPPPPSVLGPGEGLKRAKAIVAPNIDINHVGVLFSGAAMPNGSDGIFVGSTACGLGADGSGNSFAQNTVANNGGMGITLRSGVGNTLSQNSVYDNVVKNIDINNNYGGPLPNDPMDADSGPNNQQNYPDGITVAQVGGNTVVNFSLNSTPARTFIIEAFENPAMPPLPAGRTYRAPTSPVTVTTDASGMATGTYTMAGLRNYITLTASDTTSGDTSEFSAVGTFTPVPAVSMSTNLLDFGTVTVGQTSTTQSVTLTSTGSAPYHINTYDTAATCYGGPVCVGGDFTCSLGCSTTTSYAPGSSCTISASFHPSNPGAQSTTIYICDNAGTRTLTLAGNGVAASSTLFLLPTSLNFGSVLVGQQGPGQVFTLTNSGRTTASLGSWAVSGDFVYQGTTCGATLVAGANCTATVAFAPTAPGQRTGTLVMSQPGAAPLVSASLSGTGTQQAVLDLPTSIEFGSITLGAPDATVTVTLRNTGNAVITFGSIAVTGPFTLVNNCSLNLAPGQSCTLTLAFSPRTVGDSSGTLTIVSNAQGGSRNIPINVRTVAQPVPLIRVTPAFIGFGNHMIGTAGGSQRIQIRNDGGAPAPVDMTTLSVDFLIGGTSCGSTIAPQGTCFADVVFQPTGFGGRSGQFRVNSVSTANGQVTDLAGTGCRPFVPGTSRTHQQSGGCTP